MHRNPLKFVRALTQLAACAACLLCLSAALAAATPEFADFDRRAKAGEELSVVFFGASLTWGANASDPNLTSYRGVMARKFEKAYPKAHLHFWDAAIGGTGSQLGVFRLDRDVLRRKPDLVFLDFSANDDITSAKVESLASYESLVRRIITECSAPVVQVIFPFRWNVAEANFDKMVRREAHLAIADAYKTAVGDAITLAVNRVKDGTTSLDTLWPVDGVHPCDPGYELFADAAWAAFTKAVQDSVVCAAPAKMLYADTYLTHARVRISSLAEPGELPLGWRKDHPNLTSAYFDMLMSRWLDDEVIVSNRMPPVKGSASKEPIPQQVAALSVRFRGSMVMLFGEGTPKSGKYRAYIDGKVVGHNVRGAKEPVQEFDSATVSGPSHGNTHHVQLIAEGLDSSFEHTLEIEPVFAADKEQELRLESICVAGPGAAVLPKAK